MGRTLSEFLCLADSCQSNTIFWKLDGIFILFFLFLVDFVVRSPCFVLNCVCVCAIFWGFVCLRYRITKRLMVNSYVNVLFFILSTNFMVIGLKIIEPNINNKIFPYWPVLCSCFKAHTSDVKKVIQECLEILRKVRSVSSKRTFLVSIPTDRHSGALRA